MFLLRCVEGPVGRGSGDRRSTGGPATGIVLVVTLLANPLARAVADPVPEFPRGLPAHVQPVYMEPGLPAFSFPSGGAGGNAGGNGGSGGQGGAGGRGNTTTGDLGGIGRNRLLAYEWGMEAMAAAEQLGIYGSALGATCVLEGCKNVPPREGGTISGWFQMRNDTFLESINAAVRENPSLSGRIVAGLAGKNDPVTHSIAAAQYMKQGAESIQRAGISNPTVLDVRPYYQFGPRYGAKVASALDTDNLRSALEGISEATFNANRISPSMTVGEWRQTIVRQIGSNAHQTVLR